MITQNHFPKFNVLLVAAFFALSPLCYAQQDSELDKKGRQLGAKITGFFEKVTPKQKEPEKKTAAQPPSKTVTAPHSETRAPKSTKTPATAKKSSAQVSTKTAQSDRSKNSRAPTIKAPAPPEWPETTFVPSSNGFEYEKCKPRLNDYYEILLEISPGSRELFSFRNDKSCEPTKWEKMLDGDQVNGLRELIHEATTPEFPPICTYAPARYSPPMTYGVCSSDRSVIAHEFECPEGKRCKIPPPCLTERYHRYIHNGFVAAMKCVGLDPREVHPMLVHESGFRINARSSTDCMGFGQLCGSSVKHVNAKGWINDLAEQSECKSLLPMLKNPLSPNENPRCSFIDPPIGPIKNMVYSAIYYKNVTRKEAETTVWSWLNGPKAPKLSTIDKNRMIRELSYYMYNSGVSGIRPHFRNFVREKPKLAATSFAQEFGAYLKKHYENKSRVEEASGYVTKVLNNIKSLDAKAPGYKRKCGY